MGYYTTHTTAYRPTYDESIQLHHINVTAEIYLNSYDVRQNSYNSYNSGQHKSKYML